MAKVHINVCIDDNVYDYHKAKGTNFSQTTNDYLKALMGNDVEKTDNVGDLINKLEADLAKARIEQAQREQVKKVQAEQELKTEFKEDIEVLRELHHKREEGGKLAEKRYYEAIEKVKQVYGKSAAEILDYITYKRSV